MEKAKEKFIEAIGNLGEGLGLNRTTCQIYALLYIIKEPITPTEIGKQLGISKGNVSINLKKLEEWNAIRKVWRKGYSRSLYKANEDIEGIIFQKLKTGIEKRIKQMENIFKNIHRCLDENNTKNNEVKYIEKKISQIEGTIKKILAVLDNIDYLKNFLE